MKLKLARTLPPPPEQPKSYFDAIASKEEEASRSPYGPCLQSRGHIAWKKCVSYWSFLGTINLQKSKRLDDKRNMKDNSQIATENTAWSIGFHLHQWLGSLGFVISAQPWSSSWQFNPRPSYLRPFDAPIFLACRSRNFMRVRQLLDDNAASPFDVDPRGRTPLHVRGFMPLHICK